MPQFDQGSFLNQTIWFFLVFINSYFLITYFFLPIICKNLKFRKKKIIINQTNLFEMKLENLSQQIFLNNTCQKALDDSIITLKTVNTDNLLKKKSSSIKSLHNVISPKSITNVLAYTLFYPKKFK